MSTAHYLKSCASPRSSDRPFRIVGIGLGLFLLATAGLKLHGMHLSAVPALGWLWSPSVQAVATAWEIILGLWLLSGRARVEAWLACVVTFALLALVSGRLGLVGQAMCDCFGVIQASPWSAFALDLTALAILAYARPELGLTYANFWKSATRGAMKVVCFSLGVSVAFAALAGLGAWLYGSPAAALARLRAEAVTADPHYLDFGSGRVGDTLASPVKVYN